MGNSAFVFPRRDGGKRNPDGWRKNVKEICIRAGIPKSYRPNYCLRDTIASTLLSNGSTLDEVGYMLGHEPRFSNDESLRKIRSRCSTTYCRSCAESLMKSKFETKTKLEHSG